MIATWTHAEMCQFWEVSKNFPLSFPGAAVWEKYSQVGEVQKWWGEEFVVGDAQ
jgi:hypothetical protein